MKPNLDTIERELLLAIHRAERQKDNDEALELSIWLAQYRDLYKIGGKDASPSNEH